MPTLPIVAVIYNRKSFRVRYADHSSSRWIPDDQFFVVTQNYAFDLDVSAWGWIHLLLGVALIATGIGLFNRSPWAGVTAIGLAMLSAVVNFFFIPYYPFWSIIVIALDVWVIWSLTRPSVIRS